MLVFTAATFGIGSNMVADDAQPVPLKGAITNLNWFDAQRKHYETPDQIARRFKLPDDGAMRAFCHGAASMLDRRTAQFVRRVPFALDDAWCLLADTDKARQWLFGVEWELRPGGAFRLPDAGPGIAAQGLVAELHRDEVLELAAEDGSTVRFEAIDASGSARARRDIPNYAGAITEFRATNRVPETAGVPERLRETTAEQIAQPGGTGTHCVGVVAAWHRAASLLQKLAFEEANLFWPAEQAIGLNLEALVAAYAKLMPAYYKA
ncbi:MAG: hypothetical protein OXG44_04045 [Gammaproteobacteria bacterium]|nr:hypothetical protein [Gammaproteobacteria bacterium]